jgi:hypothetical protein
MTYAPTLSRLAPPDDDGTMAFIRTDARLDRPSGRYAFVVHYASEVVDADVPWPTRTAKRVGVLD